MPRMPSANTTTHKHNRVPTAEPVALAGSTRKEGVTGLDRACSVVRPVDLVRQQGTWIDLRYMGPTSSALPPQASVAKLPAGWRKATEPSGLRQI